MQLIVVVPGLLLCWLVPLGLRAAAIALVLSIGGTVQLVVAARLLRRRLGPLMDPHLRGAVRRTAIAGVPALAAGLVVLAATGGFGSGWTVASRGGGLLGAALIGVVCLAVYLLVLAVQRAPELRLACDLVRSRLRR